MARLEKSIAVFALVLGAARMASAQTVRGTVVQRDSSAAQGVIVVASGEREGVIARALTNARGEFSIRLPSAGRYALRVLRIGYRPTIGPTVNVADDGAQTVRVVIGADPVVLSGMDVRARETCRVNADTGLMVARVWDEARKAMLSSQLTDGEAPLVAEWVEYDRTYDSTAHRVREQQVRSMRHPTTHAFVSATPEQLAAKGFVVVDGGAATYYAPDAEVLLSDAFAATHCFRLTSAPIGEPDLIGVAFQPTRDRGEMREIEGTLWLDQQSAELRRIEFRYTNLPDIARLVEPGGNVEFLRLPEGDWLVSRWSIRMPRMAMPQKSNEGFRRTIKLSTSPELRGLQVTGGEVTRLTRRDSTIYQLNGAQIAVQVLERDTLVRARDATLTLEGTDYHGTANADGLIEVWPVLPGRYRAYVRTPLMDSLGMPAIERDVEPHTDLRVDTLTLPVARTFVQFEVVDTGGKPVGDVTIEARPRSGASRTMVTPPNGRLTFTDAAVGQMLLRARRIGYQPGEVNVTIAPGRNDVTVILSEVSAPQLDTVHVVASSLAPRLQGFEDRRAKHIATVSITQEDIQRRNPSEAWQMLANVPSIRIVENDTVVLAASPRAMIVSLKNDVCYIPVAVDGVLRNPSPANSGVDLRDLPRPEEIHGIEFFSGPASIPLQFQSQAKGAWCGLIAIWTK